MHNNLNSSMYGMARDGPEKENETKKFVKKQIREALDQNPRFKAFLQQNHVKGRFIKNITNEILKASNLDKRLASKKDVITNNCYSSIIDWSFTWSFTPEGYNFWRELNNKI